MLKNNLKDDVITLRDGKKLTYPQIGELLGIHPERARSLYRRARENEKYQEETDYSTQGNIMNISHVSDRILTVDEMLEAMEVDLDVWDVLRFKVHKGEIGRRHEKKSLSFDEGKITGQVEDSGTVYVEPLYNMTVWLVRKEPLATSPVISPVKIKIKAPVKTKRSKNNLIKSALILPDLHFGFSRDLVTNKLTPFHDRQALHVALSVAKELLPDVIVVLGDVLDLPDWSDKFVQKPGFYWTTQASVVEAAWWLAQFNQQCGQMYVLEGNHDKRMENLIIKHLTSAYQLKPAGAGNIDPPVLSIPQLLNFKDQGIEYVGDYPNGQIWLNDALSCVHGSIARKPAGGTVGAIVKELDSSQIFGHIHRKEWASRTVHGKYGARIIEAFSPGCLCRIDGVVPARNNYNNWQQGFATVHYDNLNFYSIKPYTIENGSTFYNNSVIMGSNNVVDQIENDTNWSLA